MLYYPQNKTVFSYNYSGKYVSNLVIILAKYYVHEKGVREGPQTQNDKETLKNLLYL